MTGSSPQDPQALCWRFVALVNAGDAEGLAGLYEAGAVLATGDGRQVVGRAAIRDFYAALLAPRPRFTPGEARPALIAGDLALTSTRLADGSVTAEVARRQPDGNRLWVLDDPALGPANIANPAGKDT